MGGCLLREIRIRLQFGFRLQLFWESLFYSSGIPHVRIAYSYRAHRMSHRMSRIVRIAYSAASLNRSASRLRLDSFDCFYSRLAIYSCLSVA